MDVIPRNRQQNIGIQVLRRLSGEAVLEPVSVDLF